MAQPGKRALLVGIDSYRYLGSGWQLRGAVNDTRAVGRYLTDALGFPAENLRLLANAEATRENLLAALDRLVTETAENDLVVVYYSGHGSRAATADGREGEPWEETLVPHDSGRGEAPNRDIASLELRRRMVRLSEKTQRLTLVFDCCHAGTLSRDPFAAKARWVPPAVAMPPAAPEKADSPPAYLPYSRRYTLIAACRRNESANEIRLGGDNPLYHGALTHHLLTELRHASQGSTWRGVMEAVTIAVNRRFRDQHPQLEGAVDRELFGLSERRPMRYMRVIGADEQRRRVVLDGGVVHGVGRRSRWVTHLPGAEQVEGSARQLAEVEVCTVRATTADAELVDGEASCPPVGARLVESRLGEAATRFRVEAVAQIDAERWLPALAEEIEDHPLLEWSEGGGDADVRVYFLAPRETALAGDPLPARESLGTPAYTAVGVDGELLMPVRQLTGPEAIVTLVQNLAKRARWLQGLELRQRDDPTLDGAIRFEILRRRSGIWQPISPEDPTFTHGERFAIELEHHHRRALFLYVLNFSCEGEICPLYPAEGAWALVEPDHPVRYGVADEEADGDVVRFTLSSDFPYSNPGGAATATEVLKLFALEEATDFRPLFQNRYRHIRGWRSLYQQSLLGQRLSQMLAGDRDLGRVEGGVQQPWTTLERQISIRRSAR